MGIEWIVAALAAALVIYAVVVFNRLVKARNRVREGWSGIDVQLRRRSDLIPNLVDTVKAYAAHERQLFEEIAARRTSILAASGVGDRAAAEQSLQGSVGRLIAVAEGYPRIKADQNFRKLQEQIAEIEDQIQMARRYYNGTVRDYNIGIQSFPDTLVARTFGFREQEFFQAEAGAAIPPAIEFGTSGAR